LTARKPNLFIVGAPKCGTTAWVTYLSRRPDVYFSPAKEPHYWNFDFPSYRWAKSQSEYDALFAGAGDAAVVGEASVMYLYSRVAAEQIAGFAPDAKIMIFLRDQRRFIPSYHQQLLYNVDEDQADLGVAWRASGARDPATIPPACREPAFLDYKSVGDFAPQVARFLERFPRERIKVLFLEDLVRDPRAQYLEILGFLGLPDDGETEFPRVNPAHDHRSQAIAGLTQRPPRAAKLLSRMIRSVPGLGGLRPSHILRRMNRVDRYRSAPDAALITEIGDHYRASNIELAELIGRPLPDSGPQ